MLPDPRWVDLGEGTRLRQNIMANGSLMKGESIAECSLSAGIRFPWAHF